MEDTTTSVDSGAQGAQPQENTEAVSLGEKGAPVLRPKIAPTSTPQSQQDYQEEAAPEPVENNQQEAPIAQAESDDDFNAWAEKKGLPMDDPVKLAKMYREAEKKIGEATAKSRELESSMINTPNLEYTGNESYDALAQEVNTIKIQNRVNDFFNANPNAREYEGKMAEIVQERPHLQNDLDALYALAVNSPSRAAELKSEGGREALTSLAQKQSAVPPRTNASTGVTSQSDRITPENVDEMVARHDNDWFKKHYAEINRAMSGGN